MMKMKVRGKKSIFVALGILVLLGMNGMPEGGQQAEARTVRPSYFLPKYPNPSASYRSRSRPSLSYRSESRPSLSVASKSRPSLSRPSLSKTWL